MSLASLMFGRADHHRRQPTKDGANAQTLAAPQKLRTVPVNVQPASTREKLLYEQRSLEISHTVFTTSTDGWARNDLLHFKGRWLQVVGFRDLIELGRVTALDCIEMDGNDMRGVSP